MPVINIPPEKNVGESVYDINANFEFLNNKNFDKNVVYTQNEPAEIWVIGHNLDKKPSVTVIDSYGDVVICNIDYTSTNAVVLSFSEPTAGTAYLN